MVGLSECYEHVFFPICLFFPTFSKQRKRALKRGRDSAGETTKTLTGAAGSVNLTFLFSGCLGLWKTSKAGP